MGGTQDNGTWSNLNNCDRQRRSRRSSTATAATPATTRRTRRGASTSSRAGSATRTSENGDPGAVGHHRRLRSSTAARPSAFYWPQIGDPNPAAGHAPDLLGRAARLADLGVRRRHAGAVPQDTTPDIAFYEANCPEFVTSAAQAGCGDYRPLGGPYCDGSPRRRSVVHRPAGRSDRHGLRRRPRRRLDLVDRARRRRPRDALGRDLGRAASS